MYSAKFPMVCIDLKHTANSGVVVLLESDKLRMFKGAAESFQKEMLGREFCDMNGKIFTLKNIIFHTDRSILQFFRFAFSFPEITVFEFKATTYSLQLDDFKERCKQLVKLESIEEVWESECMKINSSQNFQEAVGLFGLGWQNDVVR